MPGTYRIDQQPGLGRHVNHDPESRRYPHLRGTARPAVLKPVTHARNVRVFDQAQTSSCTGMAGLGILTHGPYWDALRIATETRNPTAAGPYPFDEAGALSLYSDITAIDPYPGTYPDADTGSDGLSAAKALRNAGIIPGYEHAFGVDEALRALQDYPLLVGTLWTRSMFEPDSRGLIAVYSDTESESGAAGGHEWIADQYDPGAELIGGTTSWGTAFGVGGRFYLTVEDFARLLDADGDVIVLTPPTADVPEPLPPVPPVPAERDSSDRMLAAAMRAWLEERGL
jgi:hypothetical protein